MAFMHEITISKAYRRSSLLIKKYTEIRSEHCGSVFYEKLFYRILDFEHMERGLSHCTRNEGILVVGRLKGT